VQIDAYNFHLGLLRSEQCLVRAPTFYSARCEADFVMPSDVGYSCAACVSPVQLASATEAIVPSSLRPAWLLHDYL
jgi:hypothetical protein